MTVIDRLTEVTKWDTDNHFTVPRNYNGVMRAVRTVGADDSPIQHTQNLESEGAATAVQITLPGSLFEISSWIIRKPINY
jgi:hypothetical protein